MLMNPTTNEPVSDLYEALEMAISALEQEPKKLTCTLEDFKRFATENNYAILTTELYSKAITALEQEPCDDAISRESIHRKLASIMNDHPLEGYEDEQLLLMAVEDEPSVQPSRKGHWISIDKQKPDVCISVLVCDEEDDIYLTHITRENRFFDEYGNYIKGIVAWMPLPEPYKDMRGDTDADSNK